MYFCILFCTHGIICCMSKTYITCKNTVTLNTFYCSKGQKDKTQVKQLRQFSPITYISKYTTEHYNVLLTHIYGKRL